MRSLLKFLAALTLVVVMYKVAWNRGEMTGSMGVGYWNGWQDAMLQTDYGHRPYNSEESLLK
jgi:hypothetical protein